ncbi:MAG: hypothetical protein U9R53_11595 [Chloroflexota bacterium]|nr:hypothetical protein [Chloroflexota bacterium]
MNNIKVYTSLHERLLHRREAHKEKRHIAAKGALRVIIGSNVPFITGLILSLLKHESKLIKTFCQ